MHKTTMKKNKLDVGHINMKGYPNAKNRKISFTVICENITINWGDDTVEEGALNGVKKTFAHEYSNENIQTIFITTEGLTKLDCSDNQLTLLDASDCTTLTELYCCENNLTSLNISGCKALTTLECRFNQLTANVLNSIFEVLPTTQDYHIHIGGNPGTFTCKTDIATSKGWVIYYIKSPLYHYDRKF